MIDIQVFKLVIEVHDKLKRIVYYINFLSYEIVTLEVKKDLIRLLICKDLRDI